MNRHDVNADSQLVAEWPFPMAAALGSSVRAKGIEREIKGHLSFPDRKHLAVDEGAIRLTFEAGEDHRLTEASKVVEQVLGGVDTLAVLPREVDDILTISPRERLKWTKDGRLKSAGMRTVKLRGRAKAVTFHVFDPRHIEDVQDRDLASVWRNEDAQTTAENRRRAGARAALTRGAKDARKTTAAKKRTGGRDQSPTLREWDTFETEGLLR
ncbi:hypothetical protein [Aureimonas pseudogalii]|uniref:Uncharacterized protein n=1 Tax=Aureimonas pseudogalii TaxID=1744844 RepID=A0A7W6E8K6_9HYPH|nr:hypothetical protein [Aureimonas pseudogalii]MBB3996756.1 hypothetical protein [Aureimonas pseudogalii]